MDRIKRLSMEVLEKHKSKFGQDFIHNKKALDQITIIRSKGLKNEIAGYITKHIKREIHAEDLKRAEVASGEGVVVEAEYKDAEGAVANTVTTEPTVTNTDVGAGVVVEAVVTAATTLEEKATTPDDAVETKAQAPASGDAKTLTDVVAEIAAVEAPVETTDAATESSEEDADSIEPAQAEPAPSAESSNQE